MQSKREFISGMARQLVAGWRLACGRPIDAADFTATLAQVLLLVTIFVAVALIGARITSGPGSEFWIWGTMSLITRMAIIAFAILFVLVLVRRSRYSAPTLTAYVCATAPPATVTCAVLIAAPAARIEMDANSLRVMGIALLAWIAIIGWRVLTCAAYCGALRAAAGTLLATGFIAATVVFIPPAEIFYVPRADEAPLDIERIYYQQQALLSQKVDELAAENPREIDFYFLGLAPFAAEDVFLSELRGARRVVEEALSGPGRSVLLANHRQTYNDLPLANLPNFEHAVRGVVALMDPDSDVLFVFITSHGYEDGSLSSEFDEIAPNDLYAADIRRALDRAGARWRIVVVSACYSGSMIDTLASPQTLIMTAAAHDRASFGCRHGNRWTYFGRAYFARALRETRDPIVAFQRAAALVEARENREAKKPSKPQIRIGDSIAKHLDTWRSQKAAIRPR